MSSINFPDDENYLPSNGDLSAEEISLNGLMTNTQLTKLLEICSDFSKKLKNKYSSEDEVLKFFLEEESKVLKNIFLELPKEKYPDNVKKFFKEVFFQYELNEFTSKDSTKRLSEKILKKYKKISKIMSSIQTEKAYKDELKKEYGSYNLPLFIINEDLNYIQEIEKINKLPKGKNVELIFKNYVEIKNGKKPFNSVSNNDLKLLLFEIFILSNREEIKIYNLDFQIYFDISYKQVLEVYQKYIYENSNYSSVTLLKKENQFLALLFDDSLLNNIIAILVYYFFILNELFKKNKDFSDIQKKELKEALLKNIEETYSNICSFSKIDINIADCFMLLENYYKKMDNIFDKEKKKGNFSVDNCANNILTDYKNSNSKAYDYKKMKNIILNKSIEEYRKKLGIRYKEIITTKDEDYLYKVVLKPFIEHQIKEENITILCPGFLTEGEDSASGWFDFMKNNINNSKFYFFQWPSAKLIIDAGGLALPTIIKGTGKILGHLFLRGINFFSIISSLNTAYESIKDIVQEEVKLFKENKIKAAKCGQLLAMLLQSKAKDLFENTNVKVNILGHSLGCQIIMSCLKELYNLYYKNFYDGEHNLQKNFRFNNVILLAGATEVDDNKLLYSDVIRSTVAGKVYNLHSNSDFVLNWLYWVFSKVENISYNPIGKNGIILDFEKENEIIKNIPLNELGHSSYREQLEKIVNNVPDFYK